MVGERHERMDPRAAAKATLLKLIAEQPGLKALILDDQTASIIGLLLSQTELSEHDVLLFQKLSAKRAPGLESLRAIAFVRPTAENVHRLRLELRHPHFASYKLLFSNLVRRSYVEEIADGDRDARVSDIREVYADFYACGSRLLSFDVCPCLDTFHTRAASVQNPQLERTFDGLVATLLALKRKPQVRYQASSSLCRNIAERVSVKIDQEHDLFNFRARDPPPLLLIVDRREDPVTPLLNQWTYEAMVHELIGIHCNRVSLKDDPSVPEQSREVILDDVKDAFFRKNRYRNFGDLGGNLKSLVDAFETKRQSGTEIKSIEDMTRFVSNYPEFRKTSHMVSKHVALAGELSRLVGQMNLLEVSQVEQDLACREAEAEHRQEVMTLLRKPNVTKSDKLRLVMLYSLRYEGGSDKGLPLMKDALNKVGIGPEGIHLITAVKEYAGAAKRSGDVFSNRSFFAMASNKVRRGVGGVDNVYTQHEPLLVYTLDDLFRSKLKESDFPLVRADDLMPDSSISDNAPKASIRPPRELIILIAGGVTYEEAKCISAVNRSPNCFMPSEGSVTVSAASAAEEAKATVVLMGTCIQNSTSFAVEINRNAAVQREEHFVRPMR